jgi:hypothetical protein
LGVTKIIWGETRKSLNIIINIKYDKSFFLNAMVKMESKQNTWSSPWRIWWRIKWDLKSEDGKYGNDSIGRSLGDLLDLKTPYLTLISFPQFFTPLNCSSYNCSLYDQHGFNRLKSLHLSKFKFIQEKRTRPVCFSFY